MPATVELLAPRPDLEAVNAALDVSSATAASDGDRIARCGADAVTALAHGTEFRGREHLPPAEELSAIDEDDAEPVCDEAVAAVGEPWATPVAEV